MPQQNVKPMTLMFVDIPGVSRVREHDGENAAREFLHTCTTLLGDVREKHGGTLVRTVGGTLLCSFEDSDAAVDAACEMHQSMAEAQVGATVAPELRMGLHAGEVTVRNGNCSGEIVTTTARMVTLAQPSQIVATGAVRASLTRGRERRFSPLPNATTMESRLNVKLFEVHWQGALPAEETAAAVQKVPGAAEEAVAVEGLEFGPAPMEVDLSSSQQDDDRKVDTLVIDEDEPARSKKKKTTQHERAKPKEPRRVNKKAAQKRRIILREVQKKVAAKEQEERARKTVALETQKPEGRVAPAEDTRLCIIWLDKIVCMDFHNQRTRIGRDEESDIVITVDTASRRHADVVYRNGDYFLVDKSGNGTFVYNEKGEEFFVQGEEVRLGQSGAICPGCPQEDPACQALLYWIAENE